MATKERLKALEIVEYVLFAQLNEPLILKLFVAWSRVHFNSSKMWEPNWS